MAIVRNKGTSVYKNTKTGQTGATRASVGYIPSSVRKQQSQSSTPSSPLPSGYKAPVTVAAPVIGTEKYNIPPATTTTTTDNLAVANTTTQAGATTDATYEPPVNPQKQEAQGYLQKILGNIGTQAEDVNNIYEEEQLAQKKQRAQRLSTELDIMDKGYRDQVNEIKKNRDGKFGGGMQADINDATDRYQNNRANAALVYKVAAEDYNGAAEIVNQKVAALKDQNQSYLQAYGLLIDSINNDLTESEKLQVQNMYQQKQMEAKVVSDTYAQVLNSAVLQGAPASVLSAIDAASRAPGATAASVYAAAGQYGADPLQQAQLANIRSQIAERGAAAAGYDPSEILAFAQQYASTGTIPTGMPKGSFGLVSQIAMESPKPAGTLVDASTGVKPSSVSAAQVDGIVALKDLTQKLDEIKTLQPQTSFFLPTKTNQVYEGLRSEIVDLLARARTGAAITAFEEAQYRKKIPELYQINLWPKTKIDSLSSSLTGKLDTSLRANGLSIYGYSTVDIGGQKYKVGDVVSNETGTYRINPNGTLTQTQ